MAAGRIAYTAGIILMNDSLLNQVHCIDCLELLGRLEDKSIDMILTDFPYNTLKHLSWDKQAIDLQTWWIEARRVIKKECVIISTASQPFTSILTVSNLKWFRCEWIWEKDAGTGYLNANRQPLKNHESVLVFAKGKHRYYPQLEQGEAYRATSGAVGGFVRDKTVGGYETKNEGSRYPKSVLRFKSENGLHETQKPTALFEYFLKSYSCENDTVLDCFSGSGTTAIACLNLGRSFICGDSSQEYVELSRERIARHNPAEDTPLKNGGKQLSLLKLLGDTE